MRIGRNDTLHLAAAMMLWLARPSMAQKPTRLPPSPIDFSPAFAVEGLPDNYASEETSDSPSSMRGGDVSETWVSCLAYSPDGTRLAFGDRPCRPVCTFLGPAPVNENGGLVRVIDLALRKVILTVSPAKRPGHEYEILGLAFSADGRTLTAHGKEVRPGGGGGRAVGYDLTSWDAATGRVLRRVDSVGLEDWTIPTLSADGSAFAALTGAGLRVWDATTGRSRPAPADPPAKPKSLAFSPDANTLAAGDDGGNVGLWEVATGRRVAWLPGRLKGGKAFEVGFLKFSADGRALACGGVLGVEVAEFGWRFDSVIRLIDVATLTERAAIPGVGQQVTKDAAFSPDGSTVAAVGTDHSDGNPPGFVRIWGATGKERAPARPAAGLSTGLAYTFDGSLLVTADRERVGLRDPADGREVASLYLGWSAHGGVAFAPSPDGRTLATGNGRLRVWDLRAAAEAPPAAAGHRFGVTCLAYAPDGSALASGSFDRTVKLWDVAARRPRATLVGHAAEIVRVAYAPDGRALASVDAAGRVRVWDAATGAPRLALEGPEAPPRHLAFAPDGRSLVLFIWRSRRPEAVRRWDAETGAPLPSIDPIEPFAVSADGGLYVAADGAEIQVRALPARDFRSRLRGKGPSLCLVVSADGRAVLQRTQDFSVVLHRKSGAAWEAKDLFASNAQTLQVADRPDVPGENLAMTPDGRRVAAIVDGRLRVYDAETRRARAVPDVAGETAAWLALAPDGSALATGQADGGILVYDLK